MRLLILGLALWGAVGAAAQSPTPIDLDVEFLTRAIDAVGPANRGSGDGPMPKSTSVSLPWFGDGSLDLELREAPQFAPELQARYPEIRSFRVVSPDGKVSGRLTLSPDGASAYLRGDGSDYVIEHLGGNHTLTPVDPVAATAFTCETAAGQHSKSERDGAARTGISAVNSCDQLGDQLRRYRIALTNTAEFASRYGATTVTQVLARFNDRLGELNAIYEPELAVTFELIAGNASLVNLDASAPGYPFSNPDNASAGFNETQTYINSSIAAGDFDIGHGLHAVTGGSFGGVAGIGVVCQNSGGSGPRKAAGYSTVLVGAPLVIFQHEVGHQFGAEHTNYGCGTAGDNNAQRYEPGQGVTIMNTGAGCGAADRYGSEDNTYFTAGTLDAMNAFIDASATCFSPVASGNAAPSANANPSGATASDPTYAYVIPARTPFALVGAGSDPDGGDDLTYTWESFDTDLTRSEAPAQTADNPTAPLFRSFSPGPSPRRSFPQPSTVASGTLPVEGVDGETLPAITRDLTFRLTVRDGVSGTACDEVALRVEDTGSPFRITSLNTPTTLTADGSTTATVTWDVAATDAAPINTSQVDILLSLDGGQSFLFEIASGVANDGSETFVVPAFATTQGRIQVRARGNVFFDVNDADLTIQPSGGCEAAEVAIAPSTAVIAPPGDASLDLSVTPQFGSVIPSPFDIVVDGGDPSGDQVLGNGSGGCGEFNFGGFYDDDLVAYPDADATFTFTSANSGSSGFFAALSAFQPAFAGDCTGFVGSTREVNNSTISTSPFTEALQRGLAYNLVGFGSNGGATGTIAVSYTGGTLYDGIPPPPAAAYDYTYAVVREASDGSETLIAFDAEADLSNASVYVAGEYAVYGVSYETGAALAPYEGNAFQGFRDAIALQQVCARTSANFVPVTIEGALPVELATLEAVAEPSGNRVSWTTASEDKLRSFTVERSTDTRTWKAIGEQPSRGSGSAYAFPDDDAPLGLSYYRLLARDLDGSAAYSATVSATRKVVTGEVPGFAITPNPTRTAEPVRVAVSGSGGGRYDVTIADATGRVVYRRGHVLADGATEVLPVTLRPGVYVATFERDGRRSPTRFVVDR